MYVKHFGAELFELGIEEESDIQDCNFGKCLERYGARTYSDQVWSSADFGL